MKIYPLDHELDKPYLLNINEIKEPFPAHRHNFMEFSYIIKGEGTEIINGKKHRIKQGTFTLLLPYQVHELHPDPDKPIRLYNCNLGLEAFFGTNRLSEELNEMIFEFNKELPSYVHFDSENAERIDSIFKDMISEYNEELQWKDLIFKAKVIDAFVLFDRQRRISGNIAEKIDIPDYQNRKSYLWEIIFYIHNHYMEDIPLEKLAKKFGVSISHLSTTFKEYFGENIHSFLNDIRIKHACGLLSSSNKQIIDIAAEVGFNSYATFSRVFRQKQGLSASEYRNRIK
ncbi:MAG: helix-turn-helix domain-containing protein [Halanaerobiales bacterium]